MNAIKPKQYFTNDWNQTINGAVFYLGKDLTFCIDNRTYGYKEYDIDANFKNREQVEELFGKSLDFITTYDILELTHATKNNQEYCESYAADDDGVTASFVYDKLTKKQYDSLMEEYNS